MCVKSETGSGLSLDRQTCHSPRALEGGLGGGGGGGLNLRVATSDVEIACDRAEQRLLDAPLTSCCRLVLDSLLSCMEIVLHFDSRHDAA